MLLSNHRPFAQIISATFDDTIIRRCKLIWGVESILIKQNMDYNKTVVLIKNKIISENILKKHDRIVIIASMPFSQSESANAIQVSEI